MIYDYRIKQQINDELYRQFDLIYDQWQTLPPIYDAAEPNTVCEYENTAAAMKYIMKCKQMLNKYDYK